MTRSRRHRILLALAGITGVIVLLAAIGSLWSGDHSGSAALPGGGTRPGGPAPTVVTDRDVKDIVSEDGKTYRCPLSASDRLADARAVVLDRAAILKRDRAALRRLIRRYPSGRAPGPVVRRYRRLVTRERAADRSTDRAIDRYNGMLRSLCSS